MQFYTKFHAKWWPRPIFFSFLSPISYKFGCHHYSIVIHHFFFKSLLRSLVYAFFLFHFFSGQTDRDVHACMYLCLWGAVVRYSNTHPENEFLHIICIHAMDYREITIRRTHSPHTYS